MTKRFLFKIPKMKKVNMKKRKSNVNWNDVGEEFRGVFYDIFREIREGIRKGNCKK